MKNMEATVTSFGKRGVRTEGRIVVRRPNGGKTFAFDTEKDARRYFGGSWKDIKAGRFGHTVTFPD
jgi:hypothetical protein